MRGGGANYRDEDRLVHMMRAVERIKTKMKGFWMNCLGQS